VVSWTIPGPLPCAGATIIEERVNQIEKRLSDLETYRTKADTTFRLLKGAIGGIGVSLAGLIVGFSLWINSSIHELDTRVTKLEVRMDAVEKRLDRMDEKLDQILARLPTPPK
jgi:tetrahydromethanopterin S-methyltransferase subunit G